MLDSQDSATFLEEFISSSELLPTEVRRNFELIRELDRDVTESVRQCDEGEVMRETRERERERETISDLK
jgi:hypothetical protein